jgi:hypothetical protein
MSVCSHHLEEREEKKKRERREKNPMLMMTEGVQPNVCFYYIIAYKLF